MTIRSFNPLTRSDKDNLATRHAVRILHKPDVMNCWVELLNMFWNFIGHGGGVVGQVTAARRLGKRT